NDESKILNSYLNIFYQQINWRPAEGVTIARLYNKIIEETKIPVPPIEAQVQIVAQIEKEQELVNANKQLIKIFEQKIKDRIAKVWGTSDEFSKSLESDEDERIGIAAEPEMEYGKV